MIRKIIKTDLLALILFLLPTAMVQASHIHSSTTVYECLSPDVYKITSLSYWECNGGTFPPIPTTATQIVNVPGCTQPSIVQNWTTVSVVDITPLGPSFQPTTCTGVGFTGIAEGRLEAVMDFSFTNCASYSFYFSNCCRNNSITNVTNAGSYSMYVESGTIRPGMGCNNSAQWRSLPPVLGVTGVPNTFDLGATDADGDSLVYTLVPAQSNGANVLPYAPGYSSIQPFGPSWTTTLDSDGFLHVSPNPGNVVVAVVVVQCDEYRNGVLINTIRRDLTIGLGALPCAGSEPSITGISNPTDAMIFGDTILVAPNTPFCVDISSTDPDPGHANIIECYSCPAGATLTDPLGGQGPTQVLDISAVGRFCWTSPPAMGTHTFMMAVRDTSCYTGPTGWTTYTIVVGDTGTVWPGDANDDLVANNIDLLAIGAAYGSTGPNRWMQGNAWTAHESFPWLDTIAGGIDMKHQDCDGNGIVNDDDTLAITLNYGNIHNKVNLAQRGAATDPPLKIQILTDSAMAGDTVQAAILLGDSMVAANNVLGVAFTIQYDTDLIDSTTFQLEFTNSWLGNAANTLDLAVNLDQVAECEAAIVRKDHNATSGIGQIALATFIIIDNIDGKRAQLDSAQLELYLKDVVLIGPAGQSLGVNPLADSIMVYQLSTEFDPGTTLAALRAWPNPAHDRLFVEAPGQQIQQVSLLDLQGRLLWTAPADQSSEFRMKLPATAAGLYFLQVETNLGMETRRLVID